MRALAVTVVAIATILAVSAQALAAEAGPEGAGQASWGDTDCSGEIGEIDALELLYDQASLGGSHLLGAGGCPLIREPTTSEAGDLPWGDWDCSGETTAEDAVRLLAHLAGVDTGTFPECPAVGSPAIISRPLAGGVLATFDVAGEPLHVWTARPDTVQQLFDLEAGASAASIPNGPLITGPGLASFNAPYSWHLDPAEVTLAEATIEACDATPAYVEENPDQFFQIGYCPWSAQLVSLADYR